MSFQNDDANKREIAYISRDFEAFIPTKIKLGQGQFGTASLVQNVLTGKWYCLKILKKGVVQDSELEALMVQGMLRTNDKMPGEDTCVLINELIHGKCLTDIIREISQKEKLLVTQISAHNANMSIRETCERAQKESFSFEQALALSISSVEAYESLHGKGYVHRDIKPDNIMLDLEQKKFFAIDFGFVKKAGEKVKWSGSIKYSSPEALNRDGSIAGPDLKDDIYAMGMVAGQVVALAIYNTALYDRSELFKIFEEHSLHPHGAAHERYNYLEKTCKLTYPKQPEIQIFVNFYYEFMPIILGARNTEWQQRRKLSAQMIALCRLIYQMTEPLENRPDINTVVKKMHKIRLDHIEKRMTHFEPALDNGYNIILKELYSRRGELSNAPHVLDDLDVFLLGAVDINENNRPSVDGLTLYRAKLDDTLKLKKKLNTEIQEFYLKKLDNIQKLETKQTAEIQEHFLGKENVNLGSLNATLNSSDQENNTDVPQELPAH